MTVGRELTAEPDSIELSFAPSKMPFDEPAQLFDNDGRPFAAERLTVRPSRLVLDKIFGEDSAVNSEADVTRIAFAHPHAMVSAECNDAVCDVEAGALFVRAEHGLDDKLEVRIRLKPHVYLQQANTLEANPVALLPIQRCPLSLASAPPLRGVANQKLVVKVGGRCAKETNLHYFVNASPARIVASRNENEAL